MRGGSGGPPNTPLHPNSPSRLVPPPGPPRAPRWGSQSPGPCTPRSPWPPEHCPRRFAAGRFGVTGGSPWAGGWVGGSTHQGRGADPGGLAQPRLRLLVVAVELHAVLGGTRLSVGGVPQRDRGTPAWRGYGDLHIHIHPVWGQGHSSCIFSSTGMGTSLQHPPASPQHPPSISPASPPAQGPVPSRGGRVPP